MGSGHALRLGHLLSSGPRCPGYWTGGVPRRQEIADTHIKDGGTWGQPVPFGDLAHVIIPRQFDWTTSPSEPFRAEQRVQDIAALSAVLTDRGVPHRVTDLVLEIKLY